MPLGVESFDSPLIGLGMPLGVESFDSPLIGLGWVRGRNR